MVSSSIWFRYAANKLEYSVSITSKAYRQGQITKTEYGDSIWKNLLQGRLTYLPWIKGGEEMKPIITEQGATLKPYSSSDSSEGFLFSPLLISFLKPSVPAGREKSKSLSEGNYKMFLSRVFRRTLFAAAKSESSTAAASTFSSGHNPLEAFFEVDRTAEDDKPVVYGRSWKASELRLKSWDDLRKLWFVLYKEKNMLMTQCQMLHSQNLRFPNPERIPKVRKSMCRIKHVLTERAIEEPDARRSVEMKRLINAM